jgi:copper transport protein
MGAVALLAFAVPLDRVMAHAQLEATSPAASSVVPNSPAEIVLDFSEKVETKFGKIQLFDRKNRIVPVSALQHRINDSSVVFVNVPNLEPGPYVVAWNITSADGHALNGAFTFEVGNQSSGEAAQLLETVVSSINNESPLGLWIHVLRYLSFVAIVVLIGLVILVGGGELLHEKRIMAMLSAALALLFVSTFGKLLLQGPYAIRGSWRDIGELDLLRDVFDTRVGLALLLRLVLLVIGVVLLFGVTRNWNRSPLWPNAAVLIGIGLVLTFGLTGHPSTASPAVLAVLVDGIHLWFLSMWIGATIALAGAWKTLVRADATVNGIHVVNRFSRLSTIAMPITAVSGIASAIIITGGVSDIFENRYGRILLIKIIVVAIIIVIGVYARRVLRRMGAFAIRRAILLEATLGLVVFGLAVALVVTPPDGIDTSATTVHTATLVQDSVVVDITVSPTRVGPTEIHVILSPPRGSLDPMQNVTVVFTHQTDLNNTIVVDMIEVGPNHWSGFAEIPSKGLWDLTSEVTRGDATILLYSTVVDIV